ncbi:hypothetical protein HUE56_30045 (plasmid) [Azospirillum oryzae]|uniref:Uncharacterized protein n=1 Tax=Azospirillum oryzae TaxID=286727 RepID=A0A6N1B0J4_9PROT|nr:MULTISPECIES: hypothetical protein [Azospirillum]KAA0584262.1 hypothetical protein FZ938_30215 [Azospirillum oryzae]PWC83333.1 hypothetical protein TSO5_29570 [Azospirillum sp. TSO5]QCG99284.1 hypothetical protein E6C67_36465 [Azospirillum sp. TSA2s]QKS54744.1 hypothetical protein HUE56_30045 [Azospirillum oryzae]GLR83046.1 hypothetical protein GCM10007856_57540 [Azospirillum oryzae]
MTDEEFDTDALYKLRQGIQGMEDRVRIVDTGRPGRIGAPRHRLLPVDMTEPAGAAVKIDTISRK